MSLSCITSSILTSEKTGLAGHYLFTVDKGEDNQYLALPVDKGKDWPCLIHITCSLLAREKIILILSCLLLTREKTFIVLHYLFNIGKRNDCTCLALPVRY